MRLATAKLNVPMLTRNQCHHTGMSLSVLSIMIPRPCIMACNLHNGGGCDFDLGQGVRKKRTYPVGVSAAGCPLSVTKSRPPRRDVLDRVPRRAIPRTWQRRRSRISTPPRLSCIVARMAQPAGFVRRRRQTSFRKRVWLGTSCRQDAGSHPPKQRVTAGAIQAGRLDPNAQADA